MLLAAGVEAVELSALRLSELPGLVAAAPDLDLERFRHVSVHAPSKYPRDEEPRILSLLASLADRGWPVVVHPDAVFDYDAWRALGSRLLVENMDKRKPVGRSAAELRQVFERLPEAGLCLDLAHARQFDPTMVEAYRILRLHAARLRQIHISDVGSSSKHTRLTFGPIHDFLDVARWIPEWVPVIVESPVAEGQIASEIERARAALADALPLSA
ncbi:MAG TPA: TIM barrel protein [Longimicrobiaceae bacterium]|jgi:hypothetical protein|nr:TIM barrel protein [Longimicrobiaceae bacterium]